MVLKQPQIRPFESFGRDPEGAKASSAQQTGQKEESKHPAEDQAGAADQDLSKHAKILRRLYKVSLRFSCMFSFQL